MNHYIVHLKFNIVLYTNNRSIKKNLIKKKPWGVEGKKRETNAFTGDKGDFYTGTHRVEAALVV